MNKQIPAPSAPGRNGAPSTAVQLEHEAQLRFKRRYLIVGVILYSLIQTGFVIFNFTSGLFYEPLLDLISVPFLGLFTFLLIGGERFRLASRGVILVLLFAFTWPVLFQNYDHTVLMWFYVLPLAIFYLLGFAEGLWWVGGATFLLILVILLPGLFNRPPLMASFVVRFLVSYGLVVFFAAVAQNLQMNLWRVLTEANRELRRARKTISELSGLVPICSYCKSVRDDKGYWSKLESFLADATPGEVSSGLCEHCREQTQPEGEVSEPVPHDFTRSHRGSHGEVLRRRRFVYITTGLVFCIVALFGVHDLVTGQYWLGGVEVLSTLLGAGVVVMLRHRSEKSPLYLILLLIVLVPRFGSFVLGNPHPAEMLWFLALPLPVFFLLGYSRGVWLVAAIMGFMVASFLHVPFMARVAYSPECTVFFSLSYSVVAILSYHMEYLRARQTRLLAEQRRALESSYSNIDTIKGLIPVCAGCKAVRDDHGFWRGIEEYLNANLEVELTHGICRDCIKKHFPELYDEVVAMGAEHPAPPTAPESE